MAAKTHAQLLAELAPYAPVPDEPPPDEPVVDAPEPPLDEYPQAHDWMDRSTGVGENAAIDRTIQRHGGDYAPDLLQEQGLFGAFYPKEAGAADMEYRQKGLTASPSFLDMMDQLPLSAKNDSLLPSAMTEPRSPNMTNPPYRQAGGGPVGMDVSHEVGLGNQLADYLRRVGVPDAIASEYERLPVRPLTTRPAPYEPPRPGGAWFSAGPGGGSISVPVSQRGTGLKGLVEEAAHATDFQRGISSDPQFRAAAEAALSDPALLANLSIVDRRVKPSENRDYPHVLTALLHALLAGKTPGYYNGTVAEDYSRQLHRRVTTPEALAPFLDRLLASAQ